MTTVTNGGGVVRRVSNEKVETAVTKAICVPVEVGVMEWTLKLSQEPADGPFEKGEQIIYDTLDSHNKNGKNLLTVIEIANSAKYTCSGYFSI